MSVKKIGWLIEDGQPGNFIYNEPNPVTINKKKPLSNMAVQACPAVNQVESRYFEVPCPFDLRLRCEKKDTNFEIYSVPEGTRIDEELIKRNLNLMFQHKTKIFEK